MCELFSMSSRVASTVSLSMEEFSSHGGLNGPHKDGWGIAWYDDGSIRAPGLWQLKRHCHEGGTFDATGLTVTVRGIEQDVVLVASVPLTNENWTAIPEGYVAAIRNGQPIN